MFQIWIVLEHDPDQIWNECSKSGYLFRFLLPGEFIWGGGTFSCWFLKVYDIG